MILALDPYLQDWLDLLLRWLHVIAGIAWIGSSFYFVFLDNHLRPPESREDDAKGVGGELWSVHGGGFYHVQRYRLAPRRLPETLHFFKWEAYTTWLSGFALLVVLYYVDADLLLVDREVADLSETAAIALSIALLVAAWIVYDLLCRLLASSEELLAAAVAGLAVPRRLGDERAVRAARRVPAGRRDARHDHGRERPLLDHPGAQGPRAREASRRRARPGAARGRQGAVGAQQLPDAAGRLHDDRRPRAVHVRARARVAGAGGADGDRRLGAALLQPAPPRADGARDPGDGRRGAGRAGVGDRARGGAPAGVAPVAFSQVQPIVEARCQPCHSVSPTQAVSRAPAGVVLDTQEQIEARAAAIAEQVRAGAMPPGNVTGLTDEERETLLAWAAAK